MNIGDIVEPVATPPGDRTPQPAPGTTGIVIDPAWEHFSGNVFVLVAFALPMPDATGGTWLASADRHFLRIGYLPEELRATGRTAAPRLVRAAQRPE